MTRYNISAEFGKLAETPPVVEETRTVRTSINAESFPVAHERALIFACANAGPSERLIGVTVRRK